MRKPVPRIHIARQDVRTSLLEDMDSIIRHENSNNKDA